MENDMSERIGGGYLGMLPHARNIDNVRSEISVLREEIKSLKEQVGHIKQLLRVETGKNVCTYLWSRY